MMLAVGRYWSKINLRLKLLRVAYVVGATCRLLCFCQRPFFPRHSMQHSEGDNEQRGTANDAPKIWWQTLNLV